jgi:FlaA1/EpsC-like NDP-sugar epimerase
MQLPNVLIYGAGTAGRQVLAALAHNQEMRIAGFLDDDASLHGLLVNEKPVYHPKDVDDVFRALKISSVLLALPSASLSRRNEIVATLLKHKVSVQTVPSLTELAQGKIDIAAIRRVDIEDLLGREPVAPEPTLIAKNISAKVVLVTGAGGSIGSELCRQILAWGPEKLLLLDQSEAALYAIHEELEREFARSGCPLIPLLGSVCDEGRLREIFSTFRPDTVYHAAAYKHVPLVEHNIFEGIRNNVFGTMAVAKLAAEYSASDFVFISTDKAVRPTNVMGATKRLAEMVLQTLALEASATRFAMVRFGNVLGSSGSVVPKFRQQISVGGPITVTHADVTRYFMSIPEAAQLVIQAGAMAGGGDVFLLDMGKSIKIMDLARRMIELSGLTVRDSENPAGDIAIEVTGLRPGEKLYEELLIGDTPAPTAHPMIMKSLEVTLPRAELEQVLTVLRGVMEANDAPAARSVLLAGVAGYQPTGGIVDWVHCERVEKGEGAAALG